MNAEFWAAIAGALVGSVAGGVIGFGLQFWAFRQAAKERAEAKAEREQALVFSLIVKANRVADNTDKIAKWVNEAYDQRGEQSQPWQFMRRLLNPPPAVHFSASELGVVFAKDPKLFNELAILDATHNSVLAVVREYGSKREALYSLLRPIAMDGAVGTIAVSREDFPIVQPRMFEANDIADSLHKSASADAALALDLSRRLIECAREKVGLKIKAKPLAATAVRE